MKIVMLLAAGLLCSSLAPVTAPDAVSLVVLGNVQDGGSPHIGCKKDCCKNLFDQPDPERKVVCLGLVDPASKKKYVFEATPDLASQLKDLKKYSPFSEKETADGIFLTHAHIGHYSGLMYLGREALNADKVPVYAMPRMKKFLEENGPWSQLVKLNNISLLELADSASLELSPSLHVLALTVPHRDEFSETVGYIISGPSKKALFIPDIDKWGKWKRSIVNILSQVDYAFIDGTFYDGEEISNRNIAEIPHPFVIESMKLFENLDPVQKSKIWFIHFNHTNPLLDKNSKQSKTVLEKGFHIARKGDVITL